MAIELEKYEYMSLRDEILTGKDGDTSFEVKDIECFINEQPLSFIRVSEDTLRIDINEIKRGKYAIVEGVIGVASKIEAEDLY